MTECSRRSASYGFDREERTDRPGRGRPAGRGRRGLRGTLLLVGLLAGVLAIGLPAAGQSDGGGDPDATAAATQAAQDDGPGETGTLGQRSGVDVSGGVLPTLGDLFFTSPWINGILAGLSLLALTLFVFLLTTIHPQSLAPRSFLDEATRLVVDGQFKELVDFCRSNQRVFAATLVQRAAENADQDHSVVMTMLDSEGKRRAEVLWNRVSYLADIANVAPMLGLMGTVLGMIKAFFGLEFRSLSAESSILARSIGEAMSTTLFGLAVAIMTILLYSVIKSRITKSLSETEQAVNALADHLKRRHDEVEAELD